MLQKAVKPPAVDVGLRVNRREERYKTGGFAGFQVNQFVVNAEIENLAVVKSGGGGRSR